MSADPTTRPPVVAPEEWQRELDALRIREKAATRELDAIAAQRRRLPMVKMPEYTLAGKDGPVRLVDLFDGKDQLITYHHMWSPGAAWQCGGCTSFTSQFTRLDFLDRYDARFVVVTQGSIDDALAYKQKVGNRMEWFSTADSPFGADVGAPAGGGFAVNVFLRDGEDVYRTWSTDGRGTEQLSHTFALVDLLPYGRQEDWQDSPDGWPQSAAYDGWLDSPDVARLYGTEPEMSAQQTSATSETDRYVARRLVDATPAEVYALLTDPTRHPETEPTDWVRAALDPAPITEVGQVFGIEMFHESAGGRYEMHNRVIALEADRTVAWEPGQWEPGGTLGTGGWTWRYDLQPVEDRGARTGTGTGTGTGTEVTLTYDWSACPPPLREQFGLPPFPPAYLEQSLEALEGALTAPVAKSAP